MKKALITLAILTSSVALLSQGTIRLRDSLRVSKITLGGYAQIDFNQPLEYGKRNNGKMDVHRLVLLTGYKFTENISFLTELEMEHVKEVYVEQAFVNWKLNEYINFKGGLMLIPMGIINEYHEPTTFNGIERPNVDKYVVPTTWREIGAGFVGTISDIDLKYQVYVTNGFSSYNEESKLSGKSGLRGGRQKGAESIISNNPNFSFKLDHYGIPKLKIGFSGYFGKTQSSLYNGVDTDDNVALSSADSTIVGVSMFGLDARYKSKGFEARAQFILGNLSNTLQYNTKLGTDLGSSLQGYYTEIGYDLMRVISKKNDKKLVVFGRYENYDTHKKVDNSIVKNDSYSRTDLTFGLSFHIANGVVLKGDYQIMTNKAANSTQKDMFNLGVGVWF